MLATKLDGDAMQRARWQCASLGLWSCWERREWKYALGSGCSFQNVAGGPGRRKFRGFWRKQCACWGAQVENSPSTQWEERGGPREILRFSCCHVGRAQNTNLLSDSGCSCWEEACTGARVGEVDALVFDAQRLGVRMGDCFSTKISGHSSLPKPISPAMLCKERACARQVWEMRMLGEHGVPMAWYEEARCSHTGSEGARGPVTLQGRLHTVGS
jgi:hypothetical protein